MILPFYLFSQNTKALQEKMSKTKKEIEYTNTLLNETNKNKKVTENKLQLLNKKITLRKKYVNDLNDEISILNNDIKSKQNRLKELENNLSLLKDEYAMMICYAYKNRSSEERIMFILSSRDFNQAYKRMKYFQYYTENRNEQIKKITATQDSIVALLNLTKKKLGEKKLLLTEQQTEKNILSKEIKQQSEIITDLEQKKSELLKTLRKKEKQANDLNNEIQKLIEEERRQEALRREKEKLKAASAAKVITSGSKFDENKGKLPWPATGVITGTFGEHPHPVLKGITIKNNGIDISTKSGEKAYAIFEGVVSKIIVIPGSNSAILIRHGDYLSVYNNLIEVSVKPGQKVSTKQELGKIYTDPDNGKTTLQLQIWKETTKLNPEAWLLK